MTKRQPGFEPMHVLVTVDDRHRERVGTFARSLAAEGLEVTEVFALGGVIAGQIAPANLPKLRAVEGIATVEEEPRFTAG